MSFRGIDAPKISDKLEYGRPSDEPKNAAKISVGDKDVLIQPVKTSTVGPKLLGDQIAAPTSQQSLSGPVDGSDAPSRPRSLQGRVRRMERFTLDMPDKRTLGNKVMRGVFGFVGAVVTGAAGFVAGAIGGSLLGPAGTLGFGIGLGVVGAASGAANAAFLADSISRLFDNAPQDKHLDSAMQSLQGSRGAFAPDEANRLKDVTARDWRNLLSVHQKKPWLGNSKRVGSKADRQQIREAVVLYVAKHGKAEAGAYKKRLIATANSRTPNALQTEINRLKATDIRPKLDAIKQGGNTEQKAEAFGTLVRANPDLFSRRSALLASRGMATHAENLGLETALGVVDRMEQNGKVTEQDRQDLNRAMNILGKPDREAHPERGATKDVLRRHVGKEFTPEVKHKVAQALYHQFGIDERPYSLNLYSQPRRILQSTLDPAGFNKALDDGKLSRGQYGAHSNKPRFEDAPANQRAQIADAEMAAMKAAANLSLTADTMVNEIMGEISNVIDQAADGFETPSQEQQRINQERSQRIAVPSLDPKRNLEQLKALRDRYVPGGDQFEAIKQKLGLKDHEFDRKELVRGINAQLMNSFGSFGDRLGSDQSANKSDAETALLRAISGHIRTQRMTSQLLVSNDRANELHGLADDWEINGIPD